MLRTEIQVSSRRTATIHRQNDSPHQDSWLQFGSPSDRLDASSSSVCMRNVTASYDLPADCSHSLICPRRTVLSIGPDMHAAISSSTTPSLDQLTYELPPTLRPRGLVSAHLFDGNGAGGRCS